MHAVVAVFDLDREWDEEQQRMLEEVPIPTTREVPGFISGYWMLDPSRTRTHVLTLWDTADEARAFIEFIEGRLPEAKERAGVKRDSMIAVEVVGETHR